MDLTPTTPAGPTGRPTRRRHPAARSRVVAGLLSAVLFLGLGVGMAARQTSATAATTAAVSDSASAQEDTGSASSGWADSPGSSSDASPMTSSQGS